MSGAPQGQGVGDTPGPFDHQPTGRRNLRTACRALAIVVVAVLAAWLVRPLSEVSPPWVQGPASILRIGWAGLAFIPALVVSVLTGVVQVRAERDGRAEPSVQRYGAFSAVVVTLGWIVGLYSLIVTHADIH